MWCFVGCFPRLRFSPGASVLLVPKFNFSLQIGYDLYIISFTKMVCTEFHEFCYFSKKWTCLGIGTQVYTKIRHITHTLVQYFYLEHALLAPVRESKSLHMPSYRKTSVVAKGLSNSLLSGRSWCMCNCVEPASEVITQSPQQPQFSSFGIVL